MPSMLAPALAGLGLGIALASAPGPVQAVLLGEAIRGGLGRGFRAMAGANVTFGLLMMALALGVSVAPPSGPVLRILEVAGGALLLWLALEGFRATRQLDPTSLERRGLPPSARGALAVIVNPGAWLFLATAASSLLSTAARESGTGGALLAAAALMFGLAIGDGGVVLLGGVGLRRGGERLGVWVRRILAIVLAGLGFWLLVQGLVG